MNKLPEQEIRVSSKRTPDKIRLLTSEDLLNFESRLTESESKLPIQKLIINGLLSFGEETKFEFGALNILVGPNGSGKSNLIDCVRIFRYVPFDIQEAFEKSGFEDWLFKGIDKQTGTAFLQAVTNVPEISTRIHHQIKFGQSPSLRARLEEIVFSPASENEPIDFYFIGSYRSEAVLSTQGSGKRRKERKLDVNEYDSSQSILSQIRDMGQYPEITRLANLYASFRIYSEWAFGRKSNLRNSAPTGRSDTTPSELMDDLPLALNGLERTAAHDKIRILLQELKETYRDFITRIIFGRIGLELMEAPFESPLSADRISDGTLRFLALAAILFQPNPPPLICLEEPELGMHPDMIRMVAKMIVEAAAKTQLIVSTHSEYLLSALQDDFDVLFAFDNGLSGSIVRSFTKGEYKNWQEEHTLGELWTSGELGGNRW